MRKELVKTPLRFEKSFLSSLMRTAGARAKAGQVVGAGSGAVLYL
jgi:hypothetical protein